jgi:hypothetical protein
LVNSNEIKESEINLLINTVNDIKKLSQKDYEEIKDILYFYTNIIIN